MKRYIAIILAVAFTVSVFQVTCFAETTGTTGETQQISEINLAADDNTYAKYLEQQAAFENGTTSYSLPAVSYSAANGATVETVAEYTDENGVKNENVLKWIGEKGTVDYTFNVETAGLYEIELSYCPIKGRGLPLRFSFAVDGSVPYSALNSVNFARTFIDKNPDGVPDSAGNIYSSEQIEKYLFKTAVAMETSGQYIEPLKVALSAGTHTLSITAVSGEFYLTSVTLKAPDVVKPYEQVAKEYEQNGYKNYTGADILIEGEKATYKSTASINPLIDNSDPSLTPSEAFKNIINYIGGTGWQKPNDTISWEVDIPEDGLYRMAFRYRQNVVISGNSYRNLKIDGKNPFAEAASIPFYYDGNWKFSELNAGSDEPALIYLTKGKHVISLSVTLGEFGEVSRQINDVAYDVGNLYLKIKMITGEKIDAGRSYEFFKNIPQFNETLAANIERLEAVSKRIIEITQEESGTYVSTIQNMVRVMRDMLENQYSAQKYVQSYYDNYCSLTALVSDVAKLPLDLDQIVLASPEKDYEFTMAGWWEKTKFSAERFLVSFMDEYSYSTESTKDKTNLTLWVTWGRDQTQILTSLIKDSFEAENPNINVNVQIVGASLIQAILAGSGPDLLIGQGRTEPVNYGMRGALYDLSTFPDYNEVIKRFQPGADDPYKLGNAIYGIPDTQDFSILFYRTDIFEEMGIEPPKTWEEFRNVTALLQRQNLQVGLPTGVATGGLLSTTLNIYSTRLMQKNIPVYTENDRTNFLNGGAVETFVEWTDYYTNLSFPVSFDLYNRFRAGTMPMGVSGYTNYTLFSQAAPEIVGKWSIAKMPGTMGEDGVINYAQSDTGTACVIPNISKYKDEAWTFLKWWTDANTQYRYSVMLEAILGEVGRRTTANIEAFKMLSWESNDLEIMLDAWSYVKGLKEVPGGYYVERSVMQAFQNVINLSENPKDMIFKWAKIADAEIERKRGEYNLD
ncbi:MAG: extracellular solute-binding protein [Clostridia bacterium]|nr:extracellular solute-binding protein [Clostridia bacterium]